LWFFICLLHIIVPLICSFRSKDPP
jgi:hypothetical protein